VHLGGMMVRRNGKNADKGRTFGCVPRMGSTGGSWGSRDEAKTGW